MTAPRYERELQGSRLSQDERAIGHELAWNGHRSKCARCKLVEISRPATLAEACLEGAQLLKLAAKTLLARVES